MTIWTRLTAAGFAVGAAAHLIAFGLLFLGITLYGPTYPAWRHVVMIVVDLTMVWMALRFVRWLVFALVAFLAEQLVVTGLGITTIFVAVALVFAARERWLGLMISAQAHPPGDR
jgi:hypothetical protein